MQDVKDNPDYDASFVMDAIRNETRAQDERLAELSRLTAAAQPDWDEVARLKTEYRDSAEGVPKPSCGKPGNRGKRKAKRKAARKARKAAR